MRFLGISLLTLSAMLLGVLSAPSFANAQSVYDDVYQTTDTLIFGEGYSNLPITDITSTYQDYINNTYDNLPDGVSSIRFCQSSSIFCTSNNADTIDSVDADVMRTRWNDEKVNWTVSNIQHTNTGHYRLLLNYSTQANMSLEWDNDGVIATVPAGTDPDTYGSILINASRPFNTTYMDIIHSEGTFIDANTNVSFRPNDFVDGGSTASSVPWSALNYVANVANTNYPTGYEGELIRDTITPPSYPKPIFDYSVEARVINVDFKPNDLVEDTYVYGYTLSRTGGLTGGRVELLDAEEVDSGLAEPDDTIRMTVPSNGWYILGVAFYDPDDTSTYINGTGGIFLDLRIDGSFYSGSSDDISIDNDTCVTEVLNGGTFTRCDAPATLEGDKSNVILRSLQSFNEQHYVGLQTFVLAPLELIISTPAMANPSACSPLVLPLPFGMDDVTLPCLTPIYRDNFGNILMLYQTIVLGLITYGISMRTFQSIKEMSSAKDDRIEVVKI